jgi:hypothetical protein
MDKNDFLTWVGAVEEHMNCLDRIIEDRLLLKKMIQDHLKQFFNWDEIEFNRDFSEITLVVHSLDASDGFIIDPEKIGELMMHWAIEPYGDYSFKVIVYPFGVPNDEVES